MKHVYLVTAATQFFLLIVALPSRAQMATVTQVAPASNAPAAPRTTAVTVTLSQGLPSGTSTALQVFGQQAGGRKAGLTTLSGSTVSFAPTTAFRPGEAVMATFISAAGPGHVWQFMAAAGVGPGTFAAASQVPAMRNVYALALADVDRDGDADLVAANTSGLYLRLNDGNGTFSGGFSLGTARGTLVMGDVDNDGDLDMVATNETSSSVLISRNNGRGSFGGSTEIRMVAGTQDPVLGDIDADGDLDIAIAVADAGAMGVSLLINDGGGTFSYGPVINLPLGARDIALGDVDNDGDLDVLAPSYAGRAVALARNDGKGHFGGPTSVPLGQAGFCMATGDLDGDGDLDFVTSDETSSRILRLGTNDGKGNFTVSSLLTLQRVTTLKTLDIDGDGDLDILTNEPAILENQGGNLFVPRALSFSASTQQGLAVGDVDGDGDVDFLGSFGDVLIFKNQAPATTTATAPDRVLRCWPNPVPVGGTLHLAAPEPTTAALYSPLGQLVYSTRLLGNHTPVVVSGLPPGVYLLTLQSTGQPLRHQRVAVQ